MNDAVQLIYIIMLKEKIAEVYQEQNGESIDLIITFRDEYNAKRHVLTTLSPG